MRRRANDGGERGDGAGGGDGCEDGEDRGAGSASLRSRRGLIERRRAGEDLGVALCEGGGRAGGGVGGGGGGGRGLRVSGRYDDRRDDDWRDDDAMYYTTNHEINVYQGERV
jgi:hypothetical protein